MVTVVREGKSVVLREEDLTLSEAHDACSWMEIGFDMCRAGGHGISTKESVSYRFLRQRLAEAGVPYYGRGP